MAATNFEADKVASLTDVVTFFIKDQLERQCSDREKLARPSFGIICGSGLGGLADALAPTPRFSIDYADIHARIPEFPYSTIAGHAGKFVFGLLGEKKTPCVLMVGRVHFYEGFSIDRIVYPVRVLHRFGIDTLIVTNAAGGLNPEYKVGDIVVLNDHISLPGLAGAHPLRGPNIDAFGTRFPALSDAYDLALRRDLHLVYKRLVYTQQEDSSVKFNTDRKLHEGVYAFVSGPSFETRAECRFLRALGADVVGMSTVPEIIAARHAGMRILAMSLVTNCAVLEPTPRGDAVLAEGGDARLNKMIEKGKANHEEVLKSGKEAAQDMQRLVSMFIDELITKRMN